MTKYNDTTPNTTCRHIIKTATKINEDHGTNLNTGFIQESLNFRQMFLYVPTFVASIVCQPYSKQQNNKRGPLVY